MSRLLAALPFALVMISAGTALERLQPPEIPASGSPEFRAATASALALLRRTTLYPMVRRYVSEVKEAKCSGMNVYGPAPSYEVGKPTWGAGAVWYAGTIAHDAHHSQLYFTAKEKAGGAEPDTLAWTGAEAEKKCLAVQLRALRELHASPETLAYIVDVSSAPTYQNVGAGLPDPCDARDW